MTNHFNQQLEKIKTEPGFIAALDQSGGSTPKALANYGVDASAYSNDEEMYQVVHAMRSRIITSASFDGDRIMAAILFENTMERDIEGQSTADYLWKVKRVIPILKVDKGLADENNGVQMMKPMPDLDALLQKARQHSIFGTKMRSVIKNADAEGINAIVDQQFELGLQIIKAGLLPIIEPEIDINSPQKAEAEVLLREALLTALDRLEEDQLVIFKLTLPEQNNFYSACIEHPNVLKVVALSGGYSREEANRRLSQNNGMVASFSRALSEGLSAQQSDEAFDAMLNESIESIVQASNT
ncbi:MAG: fructose bisphosphate aldolase [Gammaproteobacteria bacterium]|nr:MAG: fructose bisphosphate aldolase [Gammaproteobacteria bacterium]